MNENYLYAISALVLVAGLMVMGISAVDNSHASVMKSIEAGYSPTTLPGTDGIYWVKACE